MLKVACESCILMWMVNLHTILPRGIASGGQGGQTAPLGHQKSGRREKIGKGTNGKERKKRERT